MANSDVKIIEMKSGWYLVDVANKAITGPLKSKAHAQHEFMKLETAKRRHPGSLPRE